MSSDCRCDELSAELAETKAELAHRYECSAIDVNEILALRKLVPELKAALATAQERVKELENQKEAWLDANAHLANERDKLLMDSTDYLSARRERDAANADAMLAARTPPTETRGDDE